jgi:ferrous iron transport protein B
MPDPFESSVVSAPVIDGAKAHDPLPMVALVGSANCGKTTLFNTLTGSHYNTVNYPGATVEYALGESRHLPGFECRVMDTPGITSLVPSSPDEQVTVDALFQGERCPDLLIAVADANQLSRHLYLTRQLLDLDFPIVLVVTMEDLLHRKGLRVDERALADLLDCPVFVLDPRKPERFSQLADSLRAVQARKPVSCPSPQRHRSFAAALTEERISETFHALDALEHLVVKPRFEKAGRDGLPQSHVASFADRLLLHPFFGLLIFFAAMCFIFTAIFWMASPLMDGIDALFGLMVAGAKSVLPVSWATDLFADGLVGGVGAVLVFLPQIAILFFAMGYLEDSGYLARGAALVDRPLSKIGLNGKSFVPLLSGYACAIPAMLAARTIPNRLERRLTLFIIPLMSCSARLPVYALLLAFLIPKNKPWLGGLAMTGLYLTGFLLGAIVSTLASRAMKGKESSGFMLELPALRAPMLRVVLVSTWHKTAQYIRKAGPTILVIAIGLWVLTHTPVQPAPVEGSDREYVAVSHSYAARLGHFIEPVTAPMGLDWRGGVALISGFAAREVFVGSLALVYRVQELNGNSGMTGKLFARMSELRFETTGHRIFTVSTCLGILVFYLIALQCFPTVAVARNEMGSWRPALLQLFLFTGVAYVLAVITVQGLRLLGVP